MEYKKLSDDELQMKLKELQQLIKSKGNMAENISECILNICE